MARLEDIVVERGLLPRDGVERAAAAARSTHRSLAAVLVEDRLVDEAALMPALSACYALPFVRLEALEVEPAAVRSLPVKLAAHYAVMPVSRKGNVLTLAVSDPLNLAPVEDVETNLGLRVERVLASRADIRGALRRYYGVGAATVERILADGVRAIGAEETPEAAHDLEHLAEDASVVRLVNQLLQDAISDRATDIHFEVYRDGVVVRRRIDGILYDTQVPRDIRLLYPAIVSRVKLMSGLNIVERRLPQDGRSRVTIGRDQYDLRVSVVPSLHGEDIVIRILPSTMLFDLTQLGFGERHLNLLKDLIARPHGILFVTGPTGSGKSTTLYACLSRLNARERKVITIEDPTEYELRGVTQTQVNPKIGLSFARALRSMLRHDPDVMMVGEVRDRETAEVAIQTAMTGHLVLSTLHTNDAAGGAVRLIDMGIDPYLITSTVTAFMAQRLVRVICQECREAYERDGARVYRGRGCKSCGQTGYHGRLAIGEILELTSPIQQLILQKASAGAIRAEADAQGMTTLAQDGWSKVTQGVTTADEVLRVTTL